jgi:molecular chaperone GrpE
MIPNEQEQATQGMPPGHEEADLAELRSSLAAAEARATESKDLYLRALAEVENVRKRSARDIEQAHKYAVERFASDLVGVKDSLELGLATDTASVESLRAGMEATLKQLSKAFERAGIVEINPQQAETFNPELHEAMATQPTTDYPPNAVLQVVQKGCLLNGRLLRPARVIVARNP